MKKIVKIEVEQPSLIFSPDALHVDERVELLTILVVENLANAAWRRLDESKCAIVERLKLRARCEMFASYAKAGRVHNKLKNVLLRFVGVICLIKKAAS